MKIKELKELINSLPDDMEIYVASDEEGNDFSKLNYISSNEYVVEDFYDNVSVGAFILSPDDDNDKEIIEKHNLKESLVIWP